MVNIQVVMTKMVMKMVMMTMMPTMMTMTDGQVKLLRRGGVVGQARSQVSSASAAAGMSSLILRRNIVQKYG